MSKYIVCPRCKGKETSDKEFEVDSSINGHNIEIKCPYCDNGHCGCSLTKEARYAIDILYKTVCENCKED